MNINSGKTNPCALSVFVLFLLLFAVTGPQVDGAEEIAVQGEVEGVGTPTADESADAVGAPEENEKAGGPVYLFHLARFPGFRYNFVYLQGSGDDDPDLESLFSFGLLGWELNIWRADHVTPGEYEFIAELNHDSIFTSEYYERKPVTISQVPCVLWDCVRFVRVPVTFAIDARKPRSNSLLFGCMVTDKANAGNPPRYYQFPVFIVEGDDREDELWLNEEIADFKLRIMLLRSKYGTVAGKEFSLGDAKSLRGKKIHVSIKYEKDGSDDEDEDKDQSPPQKIVIGETKVRVSNKVRGTVTITSPNGQSRVLR